MTVRDDLYAKVAPEHTQIEHDIKFYNGLKTVGKRSTKEAIDAGFVLIREADLRKQQAGIFISAEQWPQFEELVKQIAELRKVADARSQQQSSEIMADTALREQKLEQIIEYLNSQQEIDDDDIVFVRWYVQHFSLGESTLALIVKALVAHQ
jgi:hypothetical protein